MKILHAYNQHRGGGGADNAARATIEVTRRHGFEVEVFTRSSDDLPRNLSGRLEAGLSVLYAPRSVRTFRALLDSFRPDVVHVHELFPLVSPWILPECGRRGVPVVMTCVDYRMTCPVVTHLYEDRVCTRCTAGGEHWAVLRNCRGRLTESLTVAFYNALVRRLGLFRKHVRHYIAPSEFTRGWLIEHARLDPAQVTTVSPVVQIPPAAADPAAGSYIAFAGRFTPEKGVDTFVAAAQLSGLPFHMARHEKSLVSVPAPQGVTVTVTRDRADLDAFYRGARTMVFPSVWFETFGLVGAEAMSHGVPVVASRLGAMAGLIDEGVDGLLFEPRDARDLADKVTRLWNDRDLARRMGAAARAKALRWAPDRHFAETRRVYEKVAGGRPAA